MTRLDEMIGGETGFGGGLRRRNNGNGTTRADKFIKFLLFFLHHVFFLSIIHVFPLGLFFLFIAM